MLDFSDYIEYFSNIAKAHVLIQHSESDKHFFRTNLDELLSGISNRLVQYPAMILLPVQSQNTGNEDNFLETFFAGFMVLQPLNTSEDFQKIQEIKQFTRSICEDIIQKIYYDVHICNHAPKIFCEFDLAAVKKKEWGPVWENCFGWSYEFPILAEYNSQYNPDKWTEL